MLRFRGAPLSLVHRALFHQGCTCFRVHHAENVENKGFCAILINTASGELVTIRKVLLLNGGVYQKQLLFLMKTISEKQMCLFNRIR